MPKGNTPKSHFKGPEAKLLSHAYNVTPDCIPSSLRTYTIPSNKTIKKKLITLDDVKWYLDQLAYSYYGKYVFSKHNIINELRYDTDNNNYTKSEFIDFYGINNYLDYWNNSPSLPYPEEKRYDTDLIKYTQDEFMDYYGDDYLEHWINAPTHLD